MELVCKEDPKVIVVEMVSMKALGLLKKVIKDIYDLDSTLVEFDEDTIGIQIINGPLLLLEAEDEIFIIKFENEDPFIDEVCSFNEIYDIVSDLPRDHIPAKGKDVIHNAIQYEYLKNIKEVFTYIKSFGDCKFYIVEDSDVLKIESSIEGDDRALELYPFDWLYRRGDFFEVITFEQANNYYMNV